RAGRPRDALRERRAAPRAARLAAGRLRALRRRRAVWRRWRGARAAARGGGRGARPRLPVRGPSATGCCGPRCPWAPAPAASAAWQSRRAPPGRCARRTTRRAAATAATSSGPGRPWRRCASRDGMPRWCGQSGDENWRLECSAPPG
ncbi:unnamed protein product, partial [Prorocentrum cordatum]